MKYYVVDAFTNQRFKGNPAGICVLDKWLEDQVLQNIAVENNLSETAFLVKTGEKYHIRWFTPTMEFDLCGHATLASGFVIMNYLEPNKTQVDFTSMSGDLRVEKKDGRFVLDFPSRPPVEIHPIDTVERCLGVKPQSLFLARDHVALLQSARQVLELKPDFAIMQEMQDCIGLVATAKGEDCDFVSRYFAPFDSVLEDPVTGSAHCTLIPFWAQRLGKTELVARQVSKRGGTLYCTLDGDRVRIAGDAVLYSVGEIFLD